MTTAEHNTMIDDDLHLSWRTFADNTARLAYTLTADDLYKTFFVIDRREHWTCVPDGVGGYKYHQIRTPPHWVSISDGQYTTGSPLAITAGTRTKLTNNAASTIETAQTADEVWDTATNKILVEYLQNTWLLRVDYKLRPTAQGSGRIILELDIGTPLNTILVDPEPLYKGSGVEQQGYFLLPFYQLSTFQTNGGELYVTPDVGIELYDVTFVFFPVSGS